MSMLPFSLLHVREVMEISLDTLANLKSDWLPAGAAINVFSLSYLAAKYPSDQDKTSWKVLNGVG